MSFDQISPFMTLGKLDAVYDGYTHATIPDAITGDDAAVNIEPALETPRSEMALQTASTHIPDDVISLGPESTSKVDLGGTFNNNDFLTEVSHHSQESAHDAHTAETKDSSITSEEIISDSATTVTNSTSSGQSPSQSSATSVVADDCPPDEHPNEDVANLNDIIPPNDGMQCQSEMEVTGSQKVPTISPAQEEEPTTTTSDESDNDQQFSIFTQDHNPLLSGTIVSAPARYVASTPGKKIRDKAASALNVWLQVPPDDLNQIRTVIDMLHNASLILDDVEDGSVSRRGRPATHMIFGMPQAINSAGYQINRAMMEVLKLGSRDCLEIFIGTFWASKH